MWRTITTDYLHGSTECLLNDRHRCSLDNLKVGDRLILIQRYKDHHGIYHTFEILGKVTQLSDPLYANLFIYFTDHNTIDICALRLKTSRKEHILQFKETNTYRTVNNMLLDVDPNTSVSERSFTIQSIGSLQAEPFKTITITYPVYRINREIVHTLLPIGILMLVDQYIFEY